MVSLQPFFSPQINNCESSYLSTSLTDCQTGLLMVQTWSWFHVWQDLMKKNAPVCILFLLKKIKNSQHTFYSHTCTHRAECVFLFVMLSSAAARADGGGLCMALPGELSHKKTHILQGILHDGGGELAPLRHAEPDISLGIHFATAVKHTHTPLALYVPLRLIRYALFSASLIHTAGPRIRRTGRQPTTKRLPPPLGRPLRRAPQRSALAFQV